MGHKWLHELAIPEVQRLVAYIRYNTLAFKCGLNSNIPDAFSICRYFLNQGCFKSLKIYPKVRSRRHMGHMSPKFHVLQELKMLLTSAHYLGLNEKVAKHI